jgi:CHAD domain-containing protein
MAPVLVSFAACGDFVVLGDDAPAWDEILDHARTALKEGFALVPGRGAAQTRRTWFDTFDWRLHKAGLLLEYVPGELRLTSGNDAGGASVVAQHVTGWRPARPHPVTGLPDGPVTARIEDIVFPRALLAKAAVTTTATVTRLLNDDGKTVARLVIERPAIATGDRPGLPPRLTITEIRGYPGQARRAARMVAQVPGIRPASATPLADVLDALGRRPGDYSNKVDAKVTATMPAAKAVAVILLRLLDTIEANVGGVIRDTDTEFLHDLRVSVRRTRTALKLLGDALLAGDALRADDLDRYAKEFKWLGGMTTPTRDLDVHLLGLDEMAAGVAAAKPDDLEPFRAYLEQRRVREYRALVRILRSQRFTLLTREWRAALTRVRDARNTRLGAGGACRRESTEELAADRTSRALGKVVRRGAAITKASPHESLHDLRKRCKELRYVLEFFAALHERHRYAKVVGDLKRLQDCLGEFQDSEVQIAEIRALAEAMLAADAAPAVTLLAMGEVTAGLAARQAAARADFERRFAAFAGTSDMLRGTV